MDEKTWEEARRAWQQATGWPHKRDIPRPPEQSTEIPRWKLRATYGNDIPEEPNNDPTQQDHFPTTDWTAKTDRGKQNGW